MGIKSTLAKILARKVANEVAIDAKDALKHQQEIFFDLHRKASGTAFAKEHRFNAVHTVSEYQQAVPVRDYEALKPYIDRMVRGEADILWPGIPIYFSKTSGTTSGAKYIPISRESMPHHIKAARNALLLYIAQTGRSNFVDGKMIFLQGSPKLGTTAGIPTGRLSGIVAHHVPRYLQRNRLPSYETNCIEDWETKVEAIVRETLKEKMTLISGIPSWVQHYFEKLLQTSGQENVSQVFPHFSLFVYGGVNYEPYRPRFQTLIGKNVDTIETYPASEGFIAYQNEQDDPALLLNTNAGIYFEFIPAHQYFEPNPPRLTLAEVQTGVNYALVLTTNAGLWAYSIGDTVKFTSLNPWKILVTGRIKHFTSAFGEHVIAEEVDEAMRIALHKHGGAVTEYTVAPQLNPASGLPYHEWLIEFSGKPAHQDFFAIELDATMRKKNMYYDDLIKGKILKPLVITSLKPGAFNAYMKSVGRLGGQNKVPRLGNDRRIADELSKWAESY